MEPKEFQGTPRIIKNLQGTPNNTKEPHVLSPGFPAKRRLVFSPEKVGQQYPQLEPSPTKSQNQKERVQDPEPVDPIGIHLDFNSKGITPVLSPEASESGESDIKQRKPNSCQKLMSSESDINDQEKEIVNKDAQKIHAQELFKCDVCKILQSYVVQLLKTKPIPDYLDVRKEYTKESLESHLRYHAKVQLSCIENSDLNNVPLNVRETIRQNEQTEKDSTNLIHPEQREAGAHKDKAITEILNKEDDCDTTLTKTFGMELLRNNKVAIHSNYFDAATDNSAGNSPSYYMDRNEFWGAYHRC